MIIYTKHARDRMIERGILKKEVEEVLLNPGDIRRENHKTIASKKIKGKILEIVYIVENNKRIILTCYYL